jgi:hypothetical protein
VLRVGGRPTAYVVQDGVVEEREVEIGLDNNNTIRISKGLSAGERVLLTPPLQAAALEPGSKFFGAGPDANDAMMRRIGEKLKVADEIAAAERMRSAQQPEPNRPVERVESGPPQAGGQGFPSLSPEQTAEMRKRLENMTPEQRQEMEKMRERFQNMTPEEREQMRQKSRGRGGSGEGRRGGQGQGDRQSQAAERTQ